MESFPSLSHTFVPSRWHLAAKLHYLPRSVCCHSIQRVRQPSLLRFSATLDRDLRDVLELASDAELHELANILYGQSLLSPLLKSVARGDGFHKSFDQETEDREVLMDRLESRFLFLGADAKETLRGWRPTYRDILLGVCAKLNVHCSAKLSTGDLEAEIFLHLLQQNTREGTAFPSHSTWKHQHASMSQRVKRMDRYSKNWHVALKLGGEELLNFLVKGGGVFSVSVFQKMVARQIGGRMLIAMARYQVAKEAVKKGGQAAALNLQARVAVLSAQQGLAGAAKCYTALQRTSMLFGPLLWGTFLAELVIKSVGTDYARVVKAIFAFAQIRLLRTYGWTLAKQGQLA